MIDIGLVWSDPFGPGGHHLLLDRDAFALVVATEFGGPPVAVADYLRARPDRGDAVRDALRGRLG